MDTERNLEAERRMYQRDMLDIQTKEDQIRRDRQAKIDELEQEIATIIANKAEDDHRRGEIIKRAEAMDVTRQNDVLVKED